MKSYHAYARRGVFIFKASVSEDQKLFSALIKFKNPRVIASDKLFCPLKLGTNGLVTASSTKDPGKDPAALALHDFIKRLMARPKV